MKNRVLLCIMDGWGIDDKSSKNAVVTASTPNYDKFIKEEKFIKIHADGEYVGLPDGQMGNSEVGHLNLGAGRVVYQELTKINRAIKSGEFFKNEKFLSAIKHAKDKKYDIETSYRPSLLSLNTLFTDSLIIL